MFLILRNDVMVCVPTRTERILKYVSFFAFKDKNNQIDKKSMLPF